MNCYLLADDLSGALEAGAAFRARSWRVTLRVGAGVPAGCEAGTLTLLSSETRNVGAPAASAKVRRLLAGQRAAGAQLLFKKIDSTLRGPLAAEIKALVDELAPPLVVVCPANPAAGRTVRDGVLLVHGVPVAETEFRNDPGWPVKESRLATVLAAGGIKEVVRLPLERLGNAGAGDADCSRGVLVCDAETDADLSRLVARVRRREPGAVFVGAGGLAHALAAEAMGSDRSVPLRSFAPRTGLLVSGSMSATSRRQVERLRDQHAVPLHEVGLNAGAMRGSADDVARSLARGGFAALAMAKAAGAADSAEVLRHLTGVVQLLSAAGHLPEMLAATGGETAQALCVSLGIEKLDLAGEIEPGVVITTVGGLKQANPTWMVIKPGGFGSDDIWGKIFRGSIGIKMK